MYKKQLGFDIERHCPIMSCVSPPPPPHTNKSRPLGGGGVSWRLRTKIYNLKALDKRTHTQRRYTIHSLYKSILKKSLLCTPPPPHTHTHPPPPLLSSSISERGLRLNGSHGNGGGLRCCQRLFHYVFLLFSFNKCLTDSDSSGGRETGSLPPRGPVL